MLARGSISNCIIICRLQISSWDAPPLVVSARRVESAEAELGTLGSRCCRYGMASKEADTKPAEANNAEKRQPAVLEEDDEFEEFDEESACVCAVAPCAPHATPWPPLLSAVSALLCSRTSLTTN